MITVRSGSSLRVTFTVTELPSATVYEPCPKLASTAGRSWLVPDTVAAPPTGPVAIVTVAGGKGDWARAGKTWKGLNAAAQPNARATMKNPSVIDLWLKFTDAASPITL